MNKQTKRGGIALRLILYFTITLATFAVIAGILFYSIISKLNLDTSRDTMIHSATSIASSYSVFNDDMGEGHGHESGKGEKQGYGIFAALAGSLTDSEVWLVAQDNQLIVPEHGGSSFSSNPLPEGAQEIVSAAFGSIIDEPRLRTASDQPIRSPICLASPSSDLSSTSPTFRTPPHKSFPRLFQCR